MYNSFKTDSENGKLQVESQAAPIIQVLFKDWEMSISGDFIEYNMIISVEGDNWLIKKRFSDFVKLQGDLSDVFRAQISSNPYSKNSGIIPVLPSAALNEASKRLYHLQIYMDQVFELLSGQAQFCKPLLTFIGYRQCSSSFYEIENYNFSKITPKFTILNSEMKIDENSLASCFY